MKVDTTTKAAAKSIDITVGVEVIPDIRSKLIRKQNRKPESTQKSARPAKQRKFDVRPEDTAEQKKVEVKVLPISHE